MAIANIVEGVVRIGCSWEDQSSTFGRKGESVITFHESGNYGADQNVLPLEGVPEVRLIDSQSSKLSTPLYQLYTRVIEQGLRKEARAILEQLVPGLEDIQILTEGDLPLLYLVFPDHALPAALAGDGIRLLLQQSLELSTRTGGVVLLEEPEVHLHPGAIRLSARAILAAVRRGIQVVLTTHSLELIDSLLAEASPADIQQLSLYRLRLQEGNLKSRRLSGSEVAFARTEIENDLR